MSVSTSMAASPSMTEFLFSFDGRIGRQSFWLKFILPYFIIGFVVGFIDGFVGLGGILIGLFYLATLWPYLAVLAKRWHDREKSGWWTLIGLIPVVGGIWILVECGFLKGTDGSNRFGEDPLLA